jgi:hypothetical protein
LYKTKGNTLQNIQVRNDEDLEIDLMFLSDRANLGWQEEGLGLFDRLMQVHSTIVIEHFSGYLEETDIHKSITRKNLYWEPKKKEQIELMRTIDIIRACVKYCVYLRDIPTDSLTSEERDFMKTMAEIDAWYETQMSNAELKGKLEGKEQEKQTICFAASRSDSRP